MQHLRDQLFHRWLRLALLLGLPTFALPPHKYTAYRKQSGIDGAPCKKDAKVETEPAVSAKDYRPRTGHDLLQRPRPAPVKEARRQFDCVEGGADVCDYPEDKPQSCPGLTDDHSDILAGETEGAHADEIEHPVDRKGALAEAVGVAGHDRVGGRGRV